MADTLLHRIARGAVRLRDDERGAYMVEFAFAAPVMCFMLMGAFDIGHTLYTRSQLQGVVQKTARDATLEEDASPAGQVALDEKVTKKVKALVNNADVKITRRYYRSFTEAADAKPEPWTDTNLNGTCDANEPYEDGNLNSVWDRDGGDAGQGGAKDAVVYTVKMTYARMFPLWKYLGSGKDKAELVATTLLRNQPYANQNSYGTAVVRNCP